MGYTFAAALVKKTGAPGKTPTAPATRKAIREGLERMGYTKAANAEDAALVLPLHHDKKSAWLTIALDMPERLNDQLELLRGLSAEMHAPILYFMNFDSDFLYVAATDGKAVQHVHVGFIDEDGDEENAEAMTDSEDLSIFDALLPDEAARAEFRRILAVDMMERVFSESAAQEMAALFGYTPETLFVDEDAEPFAVLAFDLPGDPLSHPQADDSSPQGRAGVVPLMMPEDAPPAFTCEYAVLGGGNPVCMDVYPGGGRGRGIRVLVQAEGYDAENWELLPLHLTNRNKPHDAKADESYEADATPRRVEFRDGSKGWIAEFPDAPIFCGVNPASPARNTSRADRLRQKNGLVLYLAFEGGDVRELVPPVFRPDPALMNDPEGMKAWLRSQFEPILMNTEKTHIWVVPVENQDGAIHHEVPRTKLQRRPFWLKNDDE